jgi:hypothetical protein
MGIFKAELRGHTGKEDVLTSRVFGTLEILDRSKFLLPILQQCGVQLLQETVPESFTFNYWREMGKRTPDVILEDNRNLIFFENKLNDSLHVDQLVEEYEDGIGCHKNFRLIAVTSDWIEPSEVIQKARESLRKKLGEEPQLQWINWQKIYAILRSNANNGNQTTEEKLINDLLSLLEAKGLSTFVQSPKEQLDNIFELWPQLPSFLEDCSALFGTLLSRLHDKNITTDDAIRRGGISRVLQDYARWVPRWIGIRAWDGNWKKGDWRQCLMVFVRLNPLELTAGYRLCPAGNERLYELFIRAAQGCDVAERLRAISDYSVTNYSGDFWLIDRVEKENINKETFSQKGLRNAVQVIIGRAFNHEEMASPKLLDDIVECLVHMRDIINENGLYFAKQTIDNFTPQETKEPAEAEDDEHPSQNETEEM